MRGTTGIPKSILGFGPERTVGREGRGRATVCMAASLVLAAFCGAYAAQAQTPTPTPLGPGPLIPFFGPVNSDGCPACCELECRSTPTRTPVWDANGRLVFPRSQGRFLLVLEGARGPNKQLPGSNLPDPCPVGVPCDTTERGDAWIMASRPLGDGSTAICDTGPTGGGVPAAPPLDFRDTQEVTNVIRDLMCRFSVQTSAYPCTKNIWGVEAFIAPTTARQYCLQVPQTVVFPPGDTILAAQIRDALGNFGERREIVVRVGTVTPAGLAGRVRYYSADRSVPNATVLLLGDVPDSATTLETGEFTFADIDPGNWTLEPEKTGDFGNGVSSLDAAHVLQVVVEKRTFTDEQKLACDVTGNGSLSSLDASHILQFVTEKRSRFVVAENCASDWAFVPAPDPAPNQVSVDPLMQTGLCQRGAISYEPLAGEVIGQHFHGLLFGDCTGNWQPPAGAGGAIDISTAPTGWLGPGRWGRQSIRIPLYVDASGLFHALEATLAYDPRVLRPLGVLTAGKALAAFSDTMPGLVNVALASAEPIDALGGAALRVEFETVAGRARRQAVRLLSLVVDEVPAVVQGS